VRVVGWTTSTGMVSLSMANLKGTRINTENVDHFLVLSAFVRARPRPVF
jgi:hypothetical protein